MKVPQALSPAWSHQSLPQQHCKSAGLQPCHSFPLYVAMDHLIWTLKTDSLTNPWTCHITMDLLMTGQCLTLGTLTRPNSDPCQ